MQLRSVAFTQKLGRTAKAAAPAARQASQIRRRNELQIVAGRRGVCRVCLAAHVCLSLLNSHRLSSPDAARCEKARADCRGGRVRSSRRRMAPAPSSLEARAFAGHAQLFSNALDASAKFLAATLVWLVCLHCFHVEWYVPYSCLGFFGCLRSSKLRYCLSGHWTLHHHVQVISFPRTTRPPMYCCLAVFWQSRQSHLLRKTIRSCFSGNCSSLVLTTPSIRQSNIGTPGSLSLARPSSDRAQSYFCLLFVDASISGIKR